MYIVSLEAHVTAAAYHQSAPAGLLSMHSRVVYSNLHSDCEMLSTLIRSLKCDKL